jgi:hypothetical protein
VLPVVEVFVDVVLVVVVVFVDVLEAALTTPYVTVPRLSTSTQSFVLQATWLIVAWEAFFSGFAALQPPRTGVELVYAFEALSTATQKLRSGQLTPSTSPAP